MKSDAQGIKRQYLSVLTRAIQTMKTHRSALEAYASIQGRFPEFSMGNAVLVSVQCPEASWLRPAKEWVAEGASPCRADISSISVVVETQENGAMKFDVKRMFDISQMKSDTSGKALPKRPIRSVPTPRQLWDGLITYQAGAWEFAPGKPGEVRYDSTNWTVYIGQQHGFPRLYGILAREIILADLELCSEGPEAVASCAAWMLCSRYGLKPEGLDLSDAMSALASLDNAGARRFLELARGEFQRVARWTQSHSGGKEKAI